MNQGYASTPLKTSRELADRFRQLADALDRRETYNIDGGATVSTDGKLYLHFYDKAQFVIAVKGLGSAEKRYTSEPYSELQVSSKWAPIVLYISRDKVCTKKVTYDCEPLFSPEEVSAL